MTDAPIFVVGLPRSGTTLLTQMLGAHPRISASGETHFFKWLPRDVSKALLGLLSRRMTPEAWLSSLDIAAADGPPVDVVAPGKQRPDPVADLR